MVNPQDTVITIIVVGDSVKICREIISSDLRCNEIFQNAEIKEGKHCSE